MNILILIKKENLWKNHRYYWKHILWSYIFKFTRKNSKNIHIEFNINRNPKRMNDYISSNLFRGSSNFVIRRSYSSFHFKITLQFKNFIVNPTCNIINNLATCQLLLLLRGFSAFKTILSSIFASNFPFLTLIPFNPLLA